MPAGAWRSCSKRSSPRTSCWRCYRTQEVPIAPARAPESRPGVNRETLAATQRHLERYLEQVTATHPRPCRRILQSASPKQVGELLFHQAQLR